TPTTCTDGACLSGEVNWGPNGGLVSAVDSSSVSSCTAYVHSRSESGSGSQLSCTGTLETACSASTIGAAELAAALSNSDVATAFANSATTKVYGGDSRPCDGSVLQVTYGGKTIDIGSDVCQNCGGPTDCTAVPKGLRALATALQNLDTQELATPSCKSVFP
ncbi:MAG: hypothetical protein ABI551_22680, partial [Polyangiaceae bacterium]